jgi:ribonucleoside-diphosphate reductase beta chain
MNKLTDTRNTFKPFAFPWAFDFYQQSEQMHWIPTELDMNEDVDDWNNKLSASEKENINHILRFFTQGDIDVAGAYITKYLPVFKQPELRMMLSSFAAREAVHIHAYSHLIETLGMPETTYSKFLEYEEMKDKHDYVQSFIDSEDKSPEALAEQIAVFSAFTEGLQLFGSFVILLNYTRFGRMKRMGQIIGWSIKDESLHAEAMIKVFRTYIEQNRRIWNDDLKKKIYNACRSMVDLEDRFIDLAFSSGEVNGLTSKDVKLYIRYLADRRLLGLGLKPNYGVKSNPLPWVEELINLPKHTNFFENKEIEYSKGTLTGSWKGVWK